MPGMELKSLLIGFNGVLRRWDGDDAPLESSCGLPKGALRRVAFAAEHLRPAIHGEVSDEHWRSGVAAELQRLHPKARAEEAMQRWSASPGRVDDEVLSVFSRCRPTLRLVLATNATSRLDTDLQALGLAERFHAVANSSVLGVAKPHAGFFTRAVALAEAAPHESLVIDNTPDNVVTAAKSGFRAHHFRDAACLHHVLGRLGVFD